MTEFHGLPVDQAMGLELQAIEIESELEWAEAQGRDVDAGRLRAQLMDTLGELAAVADLIAA